MRWRTILRTLVAALLALVTGTVLAATIDCVPGAFACYGTDDPDTINGTDVADEIYGYGGSDSITGGNGDDLLNGDLQANTAIDGADVLEAGPGEDTLNGYGGGDRFAGGPGDDVINALDGTSANPGKDRVQAGGGDDTIFAADGFRDVVDCGKGRDTVSYDRGLDRIDDDCERRHPT